MLDQMLGSLIRFVSHYNLYLFTTAMATEQTGNGRYGGERVGPLICMARQCNL